MRYPRVAGDGTVFFSLVDTWFNLLDSVLKRYEMQRMSDTGFYNERWKHIVRFRLRVTKKGLADPVLSWIDKTFLHLTVV